MFQAMVREGIASGELIEVDWMQIVLAALGRQRLFLPERACMAPDRADSEDRFSAESLAARRKALVEFLGQAIFIDRKRGAEMAARVLADTPMPELKSDPLLFGRKDERTK